MSDTYKIVHRAPGDYVHFILANLNFEVNPNVRAMIVKDPFHSDV